MMESIFHDGKKSCVGDQKLKNWTKWFVAIHNLLWGKIQYCFLRKDTVFSSHDLVFLSIKTKKITKLNSLPT
jgi:hypothetical protein